MKFGNKTFLIGILFLILLNPLKAEQKITSTPLLDNNFPSAPPQDPQPKKVTRSKISYRTTSQ